MVKLLGERAHQWANERATECSLGEICARDSEPEERVASVADVTKPLLLYLRVAVENEIRRAIRDRELEARLWKKLPETPSCVETEELAYDPDTEDEVLKRDLRRALRAIVEDRSQPSSHRIMAATFLEGGTAGDAAEVVGKPVSRIYPAFKRKLRLHLTQHP